jgi:hypothetical protein
MGGSLLQHSSAATDDTFQGLLHSVAFSLSETFVFKDGLKLTSGTSAIRQAYLACMIAAFQKRMLRILV